MNRRAIQVARYRGTLRKFPKSGGTHSPWNPNKLKVPIGPWEVLYGTTPRAKSIYASHFGIEYTLKSGSRSLSLRRSEFSKFIFKRTGRSSRDVRNRVTNRKEFHHRLDLPEGSSGNSRL